jgi:hypothetical protein
MEELGAQLQAMSLPSRPVSKPAGNRLGKSFNPLTDILYYDQVYDCLSTVISHCREAQKGGSRIHDVRASFKRWEFSPEELWSIWDVAYNECTSPLSNQSPAEALCSERSMLEVACCMTHHQKDGMPAPLMAHIFSAAVEGGSGGSKVLRVRCLRLLTMSQTATNGFETVLGPLLVSWLSEWSLPDRALCLPMLAEWASGPLWYAVDQSGCSSAIARRVVALGMEALAEGETQCVLQVILVIDALVKRNSLPSRSLLLVLRLLCLVVNLESQACIHAMSGLISMSSYSHGAARGLMRLIKYPLSSAATAKSLSPSMGSNQVRRGAVFFLSLALWGNIALPRLTLYWGLALDVLREAVEVVDPLWWAQPRRQGSDGWIVPHEVALSIQRLVTEHGSQLQLEWEPILSTLTSLGPCCSPLDITPRELADAAPQTREVVASTLTRILDMHSRGTFLGSPQQLVVAAETFLSALPKDACLAALNVRACLGLPPEPRWLQHSSALAEQFLTPRSRHPAVRLAALDALGQVVAGARGAGEAYALLVSDVVLSSLGSVGSDPLPAIRERGLLLVASIGWGLQPELAGQAGRLLETLEAALARAPFVDARRIAVRCLSIFFVRAMGSSAGASSLSHRQLPRVFQALVAAACPPVHDAPESDPPEGDIGEVELEALEFLSRCGANHRGQMVCSWSVGQGRSTMWPVEGPGSGEEESALDDEPILMASQLLYCNPSMAESASSGASSLDLQPCLNACVLHLQEWRRCPRQADLALRILRHMCLSRCMLAGLDQGELVAALAVIIRASEEFSGTVPPGTATSALAADEKRRSSLGARRTRWGTGEAKESLTEGLVVDTAPCPSIDESPSTAALSDVVWGGSRARLFDPAIARRKIRQDACSLAVLLVGCSLQPALRDSLLEALVGGILLSRQGLRVVPSSPHRRTNDWRLQEAGDKLKRLAWRALWRDPDTSSVALADPERRMSASNSVVSLLAPSSAESQMGDVPYDYREGPLSGADDSAPSVSEDAPTRATEEILVSDGGESEFDPVLSVVALSGISVAAAVAPMALARHLCPLARALAGALELGAQPCGPELFTGMLETVLELCSLETVRTEGLGAPERMRLAEAAAHVLQSLSKNGDQSLEMRMTARRWRLLALRVVAAIVAPVGPEERQSLAVVAARLSAAESYQHDLLSEVAKEILCGSSGVAAVHLKDVVHPSSGVSHVAADIQLAWLMGESLFTATSGKGQASGWIEVTVRRCTGRLRWVLRKGGLKTESALSRPWPFNQLPPMISSSHDPYFSALVGGLARDASALLDRGIRLTALECTTGSAAYAPKEPRESRCRKPPTPHSGADSAERDGNEHGLSGEKARQRSSSFLKLSLPLMNSDTVETLLPSALSSCKQQRERALSEMEGMSTYEHSSDFLSGRGISRHPSQTELFPLPLQKAAACSMTFFSSPTRSDRAGEPGQRRRTGNQTLLRSTSWSSSSTMSPLSLRSNQNRSGEPVVGAKKGPMTATSQLGDARTRVVGLKVGDHSPELPDTSKSLSDDDHKLSSPASPEAMQSMLHRLRVIPMVAQESQHDDVSLISSKELSPPQQVLGSGIFSQPGERTGDSHQQEGNHMLGSPPSLQLWLAQRGLGEWSKVLVGQLGYTTLAELSAAAADATDLPELMTSLESAGMKLAQRQRLRRDLITVASATDVMLDSGASQQQRLPASSNPDLTPPLTPAPSCVPLNSEFVLENLLNAGGGRPPSAPVLLSMHAQDGGPTEDVSRALVALDLIPPVESHKIAVLYQGPDGVRYRIIYLIHESRFRCSHFHCMEIRL